MPELERQQLRIGGYQGPRSVHTKGLGVFTSELTASMGDSLALSVEPDITTQGRRAADLWSMVAGDELDICYFSASYLADQVPDLGLLDLPFEISDRTQAYAVLDGPVGRYLADRVAAITPYRVLGFWDNGFRNLSNRLRPIIEPKDCEGLRLRTLDNAFHQQVFRALGFEPKVLDVRDLLPAVVEGRIDAQENPLTNTVNFGIAEHHPFVTISRHFFGTALLLANRQRFDDWPPTLRQAVKQAANAATTAQRRYARDEDAACLEALRAGGSQVTVLSEQQRKGFRHAVRDVVEAHCSLFAPDLLAQVRRLQ